MVYVLGLQIPGCPFIKLDQSLLGPLLFLTGTYIFYVVPGGGCILLYLYFDQVWGISFFSNVWYRWFVIFLRFCIILVWFNVFFFIFMSVLIKISIVEISALFVVFLILRKKLPQNGSLNVHQNSTYFGTIARQFLSKI